ESIPLPVSPLQNIEADAALVQHDSREREYLRRIPEPKLVVGRHQEVLDPRAGLMLFGPLEFNRNPKEIRIGVVGAPEGIELFAEWCQFFRSHLSSGSSGVSAREVPFPGFD